MLSRWVRPLAAEVVEPEDVVAAVQPLVALLVGCGLMALMFYSARHGYDDTGDGRSE